MRGYSSPPPLGARSASGSDPVSPIYVRDPTYIAQLGATLDELSNGRADRIMVAGTPDNWVRWLSETYAPSGFGHALVSFTDPFTLQSWAGMEIEGLPDLGEQVLPAVAAL